MKFQAKGSIIYLINNAVQFIDLIRLGGGLRGRPLSSKFSPIFSKFLIDNDCKMSVSQQNYDVFSELFFHN